MAFCDRFFELPVIIRYVIDDGSDETQLADEYEETIEMILPLDISSYHPDGETTNIFMKNGRTIMTTLGFNEFQERINEHMKDH